MLELLDVLHAGLRRPKNCGYQSLSGCRFVERTLTVVRTCRLKNRPVLQFLYEAISAHRSTCQGTKLVLEG